MNKTIDITPTWVEILPALLTLLNSENPTAREVATSEMERMARLADLYTKMCKENYTRYLAERV